MRAHLTAGRQVQDALRDGHVRVAGDDVDVIRLHRHAFGHLDQRHGRGPSEQLAQLALVLGIEVLHQHESHARMIR